MSLVDILVLGGQLIDAPDERLERLLVLGHATARLHHCRAAGRLSPGATAAARTRCTGEHESIEALEFAELVLARVHGSVAEALLYAEQVDPDVGQRKAYLDVLAVRVAHVGEVVARHGALDAQLHGTPLLGHVHVAADLQRQLVVAARSSAKAHDLHQRVVGHVDALERMGELELGLVDDTLVELERLGRDPLLGLDGYDVVAADNLLAVAQTVVEADLDNRLGRVQKDDRVDARAAAVHQDAAVLVQRALVLVDRLDSDLFARVRGGHSGQRRRSYGLVRRAEREDRGGYRGDRLHGGRLLAVDLRQLLLALKFARQSRQRPEGVLQQHVERVQLGEVQVAELAYLERYGRVVEQRGHLGLGEALEEAIGQRHQTIWPHLKRLFEHDFLLYINRDEK